MKKHFILFTVISLLLIAIPALADCPSEYFLAERIDEKEWTMTVCIGEDGEVWGLYVFRRKGSAPAQGYYDCDYTEEGSLPRRCIQGRFQDKDTFLFKTWCRYDKRGTMEKFMARYKEEGWQPGKHWNVGGDLTGKWDHFLNAARNAVMSLSPSGPPRPSSPPPAAPPAPEPAPKVREDVCPQYMTYIGDVEYWKVCKWKGSNRFFARGDSGHHDLTLTVVNLTRIDFTMGGKDYIVVWRKGYWQFAGSEGVFGYQLSPELRTLFDFLIEYATTHRWQDLEKGATRRR